MNTIVIIIAVAFIVLYVGAKVLVVAYDIIKALGDGTNEVVKNTPNYILKVLGRRAKGADVEIDGLLTLNAQGMLRKDEIHSIKQYKPHVDRVFSNYAHIRYEGAVNKIKKRELIISSQKNINDIETLLIPNNISIKKEIESLIGVKGFPSPQPKLISQVNKPPTIKPYKKLSITKPSIKLPLWEGKLSKLNPYVTKEFSKEISKVEEAKKELVRLLELEKSQELEILEAYDSATKRYEDALIAEKYSYQQAEIEWKKSKALWDAECEKDQFELQNILFAFNGGDIEKQACLILDSIDLPKWMPCNYELKYDKETKILIVEHELVDIGSIEWVKTVMLKSGATYKPLNQKELKHVTDLLYPSVTLRLAYELATQIEGDVEAIAVNGWADYTVKSSGNTKRAYCSSLLATVEDIKGLSLSKLEPLAAFSNLNGNVARALELTPIAPKIKINTNDTRYVEDKEVLGGLKAEQNLASMDWQDFEHLCRELFERLFASSGAVVKVTQASRDMGVDAVVHNADPILGGKIVIQAKRYVNTVDVSAVRDLWGTVNHEGAMKGILVTTSQYGPDSYSFIQNKPLQLINGNELLGLLEQYGYKFRINLEEARQFLKETNSSTNKN
jgi:restriction system protein